MGIGLSKATIAFESNPKRCLVLGGRGFIGSHLVDALLGQGYVVRCFDRPNIQSLSALCLESSNFELYEGDISCESDVEIALKDCEICYHLVSTTLPKSSNADPIFDVESNVLGTIRLLNHAVKLGLKKIIFVSSGGTVYGIPTQFPISESHATEPICSYGITKLTIEKYLQLFNHLYGLDYAVLRLANPFGERQRTHASQGAIAVFLNKVLHNERIEIWGDGSIVRDYIHIADVVDALLLALPPSNAEHVFNIGAGQGHSLNEAIDLIEKVTGKKSIRTYLPSRVFDVSRSVLCIARANKSLGWSPKINFEEGLLRFSTWIQHSQNNIEYSGHLHKID
jgi:UDP-glucose 4-epimerase